MGKTRGLFQCKISFPRAFILNTVTECFFLEVMNMVPMSVKMQVLSTRTAAGTCSVGDFRMAIRLICGGGYSVGCGVLILTPQWNIHPRTWSALFTWMSSILTFSRQYKSYPGNVLTFQPWEVIWNCSFHLTEQLSFFCASFKGWLCQSTFSSYPQKRGSFVIKGPRIKIGYQVDMMLILFVLAILVFSHTWR